MRMRVPEPVHETGTAVMWFNVPMARREFFYGYRTPVPVRG